MIERALQGFKVVAAIRQNTEDASRFKKATSNIFYSLFNLVSDIKITPGVADFVLISRTVRNTITAMPEKHRFLRGMIAWCGYQTAYNQPRPPNAVQHPMAPPFN